MVLDKCFFEKSARFPICTRGVCATHDLRLGALTVAGLPAHGTSNLQGAVVGNIETFLASAKLPAGLFACVLRVSRS